MPITVQRCCQAADLALKLGQAEDAARLCRHILSRYRWHVRAHLLLGQAYLEQQQWTEAQERFRLVLAIDPECAEAHGGMGVVFMNQDKVIAAVRSLARAFENGPESDEAREALQQALSRQEGRSVPLPAFTPACLGRFYLRRGLAQPAAEAYAAALRDMPDREDLKVSYATALWLSGLPEQAVKLCQPMLNRSPRPLTALLIGAADKLLHRQAEEGKCLWGEARAWDPDDIRATALFGYDPLLPVPPKPAEVPNLVDTDLASLIDMAARVGNAPAAPAGQAVHELASYARGLTATERPAVKATDPDLRRFQETLEEVDRRLFPRDKQPVLAPIPLPHGAKRPTEVILAWEEGLRKRLGADGATRVDRALQELAQSSAAGGIVSRVVYVDRLPYPDLPRPDPKDAQQIKNMLDELDRRLGEDDLDFHYLLLIGGDDLLPFARVPNPSEDADKLVPTDNLYASRDPTYIIPERATGRLPDMGAGNTGAFLELLTRATAHRRGDTQPAAPSGCLGLMWPWLQLLGSSRQSAPKTLDRRFGLSAQVWAQASEKILTSLPGTEPLRLCPPSGADNMPASWLADVPLAYFNLHGGADSPNWYGQRDMTTPSEGPLMPVAFTPDRVPAGHASGIVVYSEACYGANIMGKTNQNSIALRFLAERALAFVGSTVISYGVSAPPLTDADLLGHYFWQHMLEGKSSGDALLQAKLSFTQEMYRRQGYLDSDDMKTLVEFVLYGDPLVSIGASKAHAVAGNAAHEFVTPPVLCSKHADPVALHQLDDELVARVRRSLTWLQQGEQVRDIEVALRSSCPGTGCSGKCHSGKGQPAATAEALVFSTRREIQTEDGLSLSQWARVVVDTRGRIIKMAVTR